MELRVGTRVSQGEPNVWGAQTVNFPTGFGIQCPARGGPEMRLVMGMGCRRGAHLRLERLRLSKGLFFDSLQCLWIKLGDQGSIASRQFAAHIVQQLVGLVHVVHRHIEELTLLTCSDSEAQCELTHAELPDNVSEATLPVFASVLRLQRFAAADLKVSVFMA